MLRLQKCQLEQSLPVIWLTPIADMQIREVMFWVVLGVLGEVTTGSQADFRKIPGNLAPSLSRACITHPSFSLLLNTAPTCPLNTPSVPSGWVPWGGLLPCNMIVTAATLQNCSE